MSKITLATVGSLANENTALSVLNSNSELIETALENTLSRDGTTPNTMESTLDMNDNPLINVPNPTSSHHAANKEYVDAIVAGDYSVIGPGANAGELLAWDGSATAWVRFTQSGSNAVARTHGDKLRESLSVKDFGALGNNSANDTTAINNAIADAASLDKDVFFPSGIYRITTLNLIPANVRLIGENRQTTILRTTQGTGDIIQLDAAGTSVENLRIDSTVTRTAGTYIVVTANASVTSIKDSLLVGAFKGISLPVSDTALCLIDNVHFEDTVATTGTSIEVNGGYVVRIQNCIGRNTNGTTRPAQHVQINDCEDLYIVDCDFLSADNNINIAPGSGQNIALLWIDGTVLDDAASNTLRCAPGAGGTVNEVVIISPWLKGTTNDVFVTDAGGGTIKSFNIYDSMFVGAGVGLTADGVSDLNIKRNRVGSHTTGFLLNDITRGSITDNIIGTHGIFVGNTTGINLSGSSSSVLIQGNSFHNNGTNITNSSSGGSHKIINNIGYPPSPNSDSITVGASPFTYTAGPTPENVFIFAGTVSNVSTNGSQILGATNSMVRLEPNQSIVVTYSSTPTMRKVLA